MNITYLVVRYLATNTSCKKTNPGLNDKCAANQISLGCEIQFSWQWTNDPGGQTEMDFN